MCFLVVSEETKRKQSERLERELVESERQIRYLAQHASVGLLHISLDGKIIWGNDYYYRLIGQPRDALTHEYAFADVLIEEDYERAMSTWQRLIDGERILSIGLRLKRQFITPLGESEPASVLSQAFPYIVDGDVKSIMCCTTDVSQLKWAEKYEARKAADAQEAKRQQEEFIDLVSHEM